MTAHNKPSMNNTQRRVLESASAVFAEKGYRDATIAEICEHAGANVASVNYYFGDKRQLHEQVWRYAHKIATETYPLDACLRDDALPEECLYVFVSGMVKRILSKDSAGHFQRLMAREIAEPTQVHMAIVEEAIHHERERLEGIVRELLDGNGTKYQIRLCTSSVIGQCMFLNFNKTGHNRNFSSKQTEALIQHITRFSLAGIREITYLTKGNKS